jgi:hypothetical protein
MTIRWPLTDLVAKLAHPPTSSQHLTGLRHALEQAFIVVMQHWLDQFRSRVGR